MSYCLRELKGLPILSDGMNEFMTTNFITLIPSQKFVSELPASLSELKIKSVDVFKEICESFMEAILDFDIQSNDVLVCSVPKCGSSWMQTIVWLLIHGLDYEAVKNVNRADQMGDFDEILNATAAKKISSKLISNDKSLSESDALKMGWNEVFKPLATPRVIKTHNPPYFLPKKTWSNGARVIYIVRNPKDMACSLYHMLRNFFQADVTKDDIVNAILNDFGCSAPYLDHILNFWRIRHLPNVLFVAYEDLVNDSFQIIRKISGFLNCDYSDDQLKELTEFISFGNMKKIKTINREADVAEMERLRGKDRPDADFTFLRKGKSGGYRDDLDADQIRKLDRWIDSGLNGTDFEFKM